MKETDIELKAIGYDCLAQLEYWQNKLAIINNELASRAKQTQKNKTMEEEVKVEAPVEETANESVVETTE